MVWRNRVWAREHQCSPQSYRRWIQRNTSGPCLEVVENPEEMVEMAWDSWTLKRQISLASDKSRYLTQYTRSRAFACIAMICHARVRILWEYDVQYSCNRISLYRPQATHTCQLILPNHAPYTKVLRPTTPKLAIATHLNCSL